MDPSVIWKYFPNLNDQQKEQILQLGDLFPVWNEKINLISRKDIDELFVRHVLHSLSIAKYITFLSESRIMDVGTGGGFPGLPLAIIFPKAHFILVDSISKKIKAVNEISEGIKLKNVTAISGRGEKIPGPYDFVVSRAVARSAKLWKWVSRSISGTHQHEIKNGLIMLKGGDLSDELSELGKPFHEVHLSTYFEEPFFETKKIIYIPR